MSWDVLILAAVEPPPPVAEMLDSWRGKYMGSLAEVRAKIDACIAGVNWTDPTWGVVDGDGYSFEFNIGRNEPCDSVMVHVRGSGPAVAPLLSLGSRWGWYLLDTSQGEWLHHCESSETGWDGFQAFRDRVIGRAGSSAVAVSKRPWWRFW